MLAPLHIALIGWFNLLQVADMFCNFCLVENHQVANTSTTILAREEISPDLEIF